MAMLTLLTAYNELAGRAAKFLTLTLTLTLALALTP